VLDCCTKKVLGYAMAARNITIHRDVTIFHSDYAEVRVKPRTHDMA